MDLQADRLADVGELVSCLEVNEFLDEDEDVDERFVSAKGEELTYLTSKHFERKTSTSKWMSIGKCHCSIRDATVENIDKVEQVTSKRSHAVAAEVDIMNDNYIKSEKAWNVCFFQEKNEQKLTKNRIIKEDIFA